MNIVYEGREFTQGEWEEYVAHQLPQKVARAVDTQRRVIKSKIELLKSDDLLIGVTRDPEKRKEYEAAKAEHEKQLKQDVEFFKLLIVSYGLSKELSAQMLKELEELK